MKKTEDVELARREIERELERLGYKVIEVGKDPYGFWFKIVKEAKK